MKFLAGNAGVSPLLDDARPGWRGRREDCWEPVPDTTYKAKFDAWVKDKIGLDYETFTSSVLLLQGKSEKLLDSHARRTSQRAGADRRSGTIPEASRQGRRQAARN